MILSAFFKAADQLLDRNFRRVFLIGLIGGATLLGLLYWGVFALWPSDGAEDPVGLWGWIWAAISGVFSLMGPLATVGAFLFVSYFLFPALSTMVMGMFLDNIVDAVENKHFPDEKSPRGYGIYESFLMALSIAGRLILANLLALPFYFLLLFTAIGPLLLFVALNAYLLGREYFEQVALRHFDRRTCKMMRRQARDRVMMTGLVTAGLYLVPIANLFAPLLGMAMMVHVFHDVKAEHEDYAFAQAGARHKAAHQKADTKNNQKTTSEG